MKRLLYWIYLIEWYTSHIGSEFKGCAPVCYAEWQNCELKDMLTNPDWYKDNWYYFIIEYLREKESKSF